MEPRALTAREVNRLRAMKDPDESNIFAIAWSCGMLREDAEAWYDSVPAGDVTRLVQKIFDVSGLTEGARFQG